MSKVQSEALREAITLIKEQADEKKRNYVETVELELQIGVKNNDPQANKLFSVSVKLPHILLPHPKVKICILGDDQHVEEAEKTESKKKLNKSKKLVKKLAKKHHTPHVTIVITHHDERENCHGI